MVFWYKHTSVRKELHMFGYLDAATGSMIASAVAGGAAGMSVAGKMAVQKFKGKFRRSTDGPIDETGETADVSPVT